MPYQNLGLDLEKLKATEIITIVCYHKLRLMKGQILYNLL